MRKIAEILGGFWKIYVLICFWILLIGLYPLYLLFLLNEKHFKKGFNVLLFHTGFLMYIVGIFMDVKNKHYIKKGQAYVITPNHSSYLDIIIIYQTFSQYFVFMGKKELVDVPFFNIFFKKMNVTVDRKSKMSGMRAMVRCGNELDKGNSVVMFPEGSISKKLPLMGKFKAGAFKLAVDKQVPIIPITFLTNYKRLENKGLFTGRSGPGMARAIIHEPIPTIGMTEEDLKPLAEKVYNIINAPILEYNNIKQ